MTESGSSEYAAALKLVESIILPAGGRYLENSFESEADLKNLQKTATKFFMHSMSQCKFISTLAFPDERKFLEDVYVPLKISSANAFQAAEKIDSDGILITSSTNIFQDNNLLLINDNAGMGKSTLSKRVALNVINNTQEIPLFIELRNVDSRPLTIQISELLGINLNVLMKGFSPFPFVYIFDGLDEVPFDIRGDVAKRISEFAHELPDARILVTSRKEIHLANLTDFYIMSIDKLEERDAFEIIRRYDPSGDLADNLIKTIEAESSSNLREFLSTPLYVSLLFFSYRYKASIPNKKHIFYGQVFDALFERHDLSKDTAYVRPKHSKLDSAQFEQVLRRLAVFCLSHNGKLGFDRSELEDVVSDLLSKMRGISCNPVSYVKDLTSTVPLFVADGTQLKWSHKSMMEYFAAKFICNDTNGEQRKTLLSLHDSAEWSSYYNLFDLCFDIDFSSFRASIVQKVLTDFIEHHTAIATAVRSPRIRPIDIDYRCAVTFFGPHVITFLDDGLDLDRGMSTQTAKRIGTLAATLGAEKSSSPSFYQVRGDLYGLKASSDTPLEKASHSSWFVGSASNKNGQILKLLRFRCPELFLDESYVPLTTNLSKEIVDTDTHQIFKVSANPIELLDKAANYGYITGLLFYGMKNTCLSRQAVESELKAIEADDSDGVNELLLLLN